MDIGEHFLKDVIFQYKKLKKMADKSIEQVDDENFFKFLDEEDNSIAIIVKHIAGNMRSRWTDFLTSDGEKPDRNRPSEFEILENHTKEDLIEIWENSWSILFETLHNLHPDQLMQDITIRSEEHSVLEALHRQMTHYAAHIGQIVLLAKHHKQKDWKTLSIPKDKTQFTGGQYKQN